jgi:hypothetical protein
MKRSDPVPVDRLWEQESVLAVARIILSIAAPDELPLLEATATVQSRRYIRHDKDMLRSGLDSTVPVFTVTALAAGQTVVTFLASVLGDAVREEATDVARAWLDRVFQRLRPVEKSEAAEKTKATVPLIPDGAEPLSPQQLQLVRQRVQTTLTIAEMDPETARLCADAVVGLLALPASTRHDQSR